MAISPEPTWFIDAGRPEGAVDIIRGVGETDSDTSPATSDPGFEARLRMLRTLPPGLARL